MIERQEIHCHNCDKYVQFNLDTDMDGNHVLKCPNCGHEHCRVVHKGKISDTRWAQRNGSFVGTPPNGMPVYQVAGNIQYTVVSTYTTYTTVTITANSTGSSFLYGAWLNNSGGTALA